MGYNVAEIILQNQQNMRDTNNAKQEKYEAGLRDYIQQLMAKEEYNPNAKKSFLDTIAPWETKNERSIKLNNLLDEAKEELYGSDYKQYKQSNMTWGARALTGKDYYDEDRKINPNKNYISALQDENNIGYTNNKDNSWKRGW